MDFAKEELFVGKLKAMPTDSDVKNLFDAYTPTKTFEKNVNLLGQSPDIKRTHLYAAATILQSLSKEYPQLVVELSQSKTTTKPDVASAIVKFIRKTRNVTCMKCDGHYSPYSSINNGSLLICHFCDRPSHKGCYTDSVTDCEAGIVFLCTTCHGRPTPPVRATVSVTTPPTLANQPLAQKAKPSESSPSTSAAVQHELEHSPPNRTKTCFDRSKDVCPLLISGTCPHGISGKNCQSYHPPWCHRFQKNGPKGKRGCSKPHDKCRFFHPTLCQTAIATGVCLSSTCKEVHIRGTITTQNGLQKSKNPKRSQQPQHPRSDGPPRNQPYRRDQPRRDQPNTSSNSDRRSDRRRTDSTSSDAPQQHGRVRNRENAAPPNCSTEPPTETTRSVSFSTSESFQEKEDFRKHLSQIKADLRQEIAVSIQAAIQALQIHQHHAHQFSHLQHPPPQMQHTPQFNRSTHTQVFPQNLNQTFQQQM